MNSNLLRCYVIPLVDGVFYMETFPLTEIKLFMYTPETKRMTYIGNPDLWNVLQKKFEERQVRKHAKKLIIIFE